MWRSAAVRGAARGLRARSLQWQLAGLGAGCGLAGSIWLSSDLCVSAAGTAAPSAVSARAAGGAAGIGSPAAAALRAQGLDVRLVPCLDDNYAVLVHDEVTDVTFVVDTPDAAPVISALKEAGWAPNYILNTHHHHDHVQGNPEVKKAFPNAQIVGPRNRTAEYTKEYPKMAGPQEEHIPAVDQQVGEGDYIRIGRFHVEVLDIGGHTDGHICFYFPDLPLAFTGDCLFTMGCGRVFTGRYDRMLTSMRKLRALPDNTVVYSGHEYTSTNGKFALSVEPHNVELQRRLEAVEVMRAAGEATIPTLLGKEKETNPFLRFDHPSVRAVLPPHAGDAGDLAAFTAVRRWKDTGKKPQ